jgi:hypothetical protein
MLDDTYFYNATIRKTVAVFGSIFNNIYTGKLISGKLEKVSRVPLAYGPRERFLVRIRDADNSTNSEVAIRLPRMSFEITSITYDSQAVLNRNNVRTFPIDGDNGQKTVIRQSVPYILGMQLSILADNQDSGLQILEQILPNFAPEYTLSVKDMEGPGTKTDVPFILNGVTLQDDYEGDFESGRRSIIYTLDFAIKIKFIGSVTKKAKVTKEITVNLSTDSPCDPDTVPNDKVHIGLGDPENDTEENYTVVTTYGFD